MTHRSLGLAAGLVLAVTLSGAVAWAAQTPQDQPPAQPADPKTIVEGACTSCHGLDFIAERRKARDGWDFTVRRMMDKGADLGVDDIDRVVDYLAKTYPAEAKPADAPGPN